MRARPLVSVLGSANRAASVKGMRNPFYLGLFLLSSSTTLRIPPQWKYSKHPLPASYLFLEGRVLPTAYLTRTKCSLLQIAAGLLVHWSRKWNNISWKTKTHISFDSQKKKTQGWPLCAWASTFCQVERSCGSGGQSLESARTEFRSYPHYLKSCVPLDKWFTLNAFFTCLLWRLKAI